MVTLPVESARNPVGCTPVECGDSTHGIAVTYLGVSGLLIEHERHVLLTAPFFSNPSFNEVRPRVRRVLRSTPRIMPDTQIIEKLLPHAADRARAILVGHGHYDHLMDIPYIATHRATFATIYGGPSVRHMLMGDSALRANGGERVVAISLGAAGSPRRQGRWYYTDDSAYRFMAVVAGHAPTYRAWKKSYTFTMGTVDADLDSLPHTAAEWKLGEPYAFIIDVLADRTRETVFRIYFQDAPSEPPLGFPPDSLLAERRIDLAVLCAATSSNVSNTPDSLLAIIKPMQVIVGHWEDFFRSRSLPPQVGVATDVAAFRRSLSRELPESTPWVMPLPQSTFRFRESRSGAQLSPSHDQESPDRF
ncbi:MAG TPA: hypothetical protein VK648_06350 [Gemmatimonadaceae bacterium]|nr:hypothetical protein [Gemmatimonadaceae bacterium]